MSSQSKFKRITAFGVSLILALGGLLVVSPLAAVTSASADPIPPDPATRATVTADGLPTVQINGVAWSQAIAGNVVYVGGEFTSARPAGAALGTNETARTNLLAYDLITGELISSFNPVLNGIVKTVQISPDGTRIYVGGSFTSVNGVNRYRIAAFDAATGSLLPFSPGPDAQVSTILVTSTAVYFGGNFSAVNGNARTRLAAVSPSGTLLAWAPTADNRVLDMVLAPDSSKIIVGGSFQKLNGSDVWGMGALDPATGAGLPWLINSTVRDYGSSASIYSLSVDEDTVYGTGYWYGGVGNYESVFAANPSDGSIKWLADCHGDTYSSVSMEGVIYTASHTHSCDNLPTGYPEQSPRVWFRGLAFTKEATGRLEANNQSGYGNFVGNPAPSMLHFFPDINTGTFTGQGQGGFDVTGNGNYLVMGGEFTKVNGTAQQGLVRFAKSSIAPSKQSVRIFGADYVPTIAIVDGRVRVSWPSNWDRDSEALTYQIIRNGVVNAPIAQAVTKSNWWIRPTMAAFDTTAVAGQTYTYRVRTVDSQGNVANGDAVSYTIPALAPAPPYVTSVTKDAPLYLWRLGETSGATVADYLGAGAATARGTYTRNQAGAILGEPNKAIKLTNGWVSSNALTVDPQNFTVEAWIKTNSTKGGQILGFGNSATAVSTSFDRSVYMNNDGTIYFAVRPGDIATVNSAGSYNDNAWHHVAASLSASGMALYVDGVQVGFRADVTSAGHYNGYWRSGSDSLAGFPGVRTQSAFVGIVDEIAVYPKALSADRLIAHKEVGLTGLEPNSLPTSAFILTAADTQISVNGSTSTDSDGSIASYSWNFGDSTSAVGVTTSHAYAAPGTYTVTLTVTDDRGGAGTSSQQVVVNAAPTAAFSTTQNLLSAGFDGMASTDIDGTIASYSWNFGDGSNGTGATVNHAYAAGGTYAVVLTVTDDKGAIGTTSHVITANAPPTAAFTFNPNLLSVGFDGSTSSDSDGNVSSYQWNFGDGETESTPNPTHLYAAAGTYAVTLTVTDNLGATATATHQITANAAPPANLSPTAEFVSNATALTLNVDGSASTDSDGTIAAYAWDFGDGAVGTGPTFSHIYATAGTYIVSLTVQDDDGSSNVSAKSVTVTAPVIALLAQDTFTRTVAAGFGTAEVGGAWTISSSVADFSVANGVGRVNLSTAGASRDARLNSVNSSSTETAATFSLANAPTGGGVYMSLIGRRVGNSGDYRLKVRVSSTGVVNASMVKVVAGVETTLQSVNLSGLTYVVGQKLSVRLSVTGTGSTALKAKVWDATTTEPATWLLNTSDSTAALQGAGATALNLYLSGTATAVPMVVTVDDVTVKPIA